MVVGEMIIANLKKEKKYLNRDNVYLPHIVLIDKIIEEIHFPE